MDIACLFVDSRIESESKEMIRGESRRSISANVEDFRNNVNSPDFSHIEDKTSPLVDTLTNLTLVPFSRIFS